MKKLFIALSLCACLSACDQGNKIVIKDKVTFLPPNKKVLSIRADADGYYYTLSDMLEDDVADCYDVYIAHTYKLADYHYQICERKE